MTIRFVRSAEAEVAEIQSWYEERQSGLGDYFRERLSSGLQAIEDDPHRFPLEETNATNHDVRRCRLKTFPHRIIFEIREDLAAVLAVAHNARLPGYWFTRFDELDESAN